jgi:mRNA-degrading endonuclease RelE of RelBE toxin-antitoxin system
MVAGDEGLASRPLRFQKYSYNLARMRYEILLAPRAVEDLKRLRARIRSEVREALESHLRHQPQKQSRSRIKRLRGITRPQYRLRVGEVRVFYDVSETSVEVLAILEKEEVSEWLERSGRRG